MLHIVDQIKETAIRIITRYCDGAYGGPRLQERHIRVLADALAVELLPAILAAVQGAVSDAARHMMPTTIVVSRDLVDPKPQD